MSLKLMDGTMGYAGRALAEVKRGGLSEGVFNLPMWVGRTGEIRIGIPVEDPQYNGDMMQIIIAPEELFSAIGKAYENKAVC